MKTVSIEMNINGRTARSALDTRVVLVDFLREAQRLTGTHRGCDTSQCGACTVELDGRAVKSCTVLAVQADGCAVTTIEGVSPAGHLDDLQQAFSRLHALQCGYCTPGMVMAAREILRSLPLPTEEQVRHALHGNICRCTGYQNIVDAIVQTARARHAAANNQGDESIALASQEGV